MPPRSHSEAVPCARQMAHLRAALSELVSARAYARDLDADPWVFAVEIATMQALGLTGNDLRWLICRAYVEHAGEVTHLGEDERSYRKTGRLKFCRRTCFILTDAGLRFYWAAVQAPGDQEEAPPEASLNSTYGHNGHAGPQSNAPARPHWDPDRQELRLGRAIVKNFKVPAPNQEIVLAAFEEEGWPSRIDDPIPPRQEIEPKRRLHDTIISLNRCQKRPLLRFLGDGSGRGVRWEPALLATSVSPPERAHGATNGRVEASAGLQPPDRH